MIRFRFRSTPPEDPTPAQRERLLMLIVAGASEGPGLMQSNCRLMFGRDLAEHGRIGETDTSAAVDVIRERVWGEREEGY